MAALKLRLPGGGLVGDVGNDDKAVDVGDVGPLASVDDAFSCSDFRLGKHKFNASGCKYLELRCDELRRTKLRLLMMGFNMSCC